MCESHGVLQCLKLFEKMYQGKLQTLVWDAMLVDTNMTTSMGTGNHKKHLEFYVVPSPPKIEVVMQHPTLHIDIRLCHASIDIHVKLTNTMLLNTNQLPTQTINF